MLNGLIERIPSMLNETKMSFLGTFTSFRKLLEGNDDRGMSVSSRSDFSGDIPTNIFALRNAEDNT